MSRNFGNRVCADLHCVLAVSRVEKLSQPASLPITWQQRQTCLCITAPVKPACPAALNLPFLSAWPRPQSLTAWLFIFYGWLPIPYSQRFSPTFPTFCWGFHLVFISTSNSSCLQLNSPIFYIFYEPPHTFSTENAKSDFAFYPPLQAPYWIWDPSLKTWKNSLNVV